MVLNVSKINLIGVVELVMSRLSFILESPLFHFICYFIVYLIIWVIHDFVRSICRKFKRHIKNVKKLNKFVDNTSNL